MAEAFAQYLDVNALRKKQARMGVAQAVKRRVGQAGSAHDSQEILRCAVGVERPAKRVREYMA